MSEPVVHLTTDDVRFLVGVACPNLTRDVIDARFDTWLAGHDRDVAGIAWEECHKVIQDAMSPTVVYPAPNPYREVSK